ncbi:MAG: alkylmercury lyase family protein [Candidatus Heimdallarchaeota archaeon]
MIIEPEATERVAQLFREACCIEDMDGKFGKTLSVEENAVRQFILTQAPILGRIPSLDEIKQAFTHYPPEQQTAILAKLDQLDVLHLSSDKTAIVAAYPFSGPETVHLVTIKSKDSKPFFAMCAVDALGISFMFNSDVSIESKCFHCGEKIRVDIKNNRITALTPENIVVWGDMEYCDCAATSVCKNINFFSSEKHFADWQKENPRRRGELLQLGEALYLGKLFFENRIK